MHTQHNGVACIPEHPGSVGDSVGEGQCRHLAAAAAEAEEEADEYTASWGVSNAAAGLPGV